MLQTFFLFSKRIFVTFLHDKNEYKTWKYFLRDGVYHHSVFTTTSLDSSPPFWVRVRQLRWAKQTSSHYCFDAHFCRRRFYCCAYWNVYDYCLLSVSVYDDYWNWNCLLVAHDHDSHADCHYSGDSAEPRGAWIAAFSSPTTFAPRR